METGSKNIRVNGQPAKDSSEICDYLRPGAIGQ
jgi:hypothetical protein